jgi:hypothetical protein
MRVLPQKHPMKRKKKFSSGALTVVKNIACHIILGVKEAHVTPARMTYLFH